ncbi:MAG: hypothetical protein COW90_03365 [Nitrospirae bacterium CG22_combo_CG10-13_8_21_14_all_44_11]|nr:MAG: hypothetical protein AUJ60_05035 [Nitrospirae bacterium CG1_02_44_142]PIP70791.1 MAG: hypothetical protein COW90_03365 [Nitrospirae bacterium CG22_combo_CG10-13_8_21_14_all_44_11]PIV43644.1 MAG: hypothetical protein COS28_01780 [Nitrospirae bacterium CG02_land_8_20_14_3_00_44_33]PJA82025.1 MAG: hypothetical protein CO147_06940 [Nitrospirae bacterium CG_4_9_14_3_um_filter_44_28]
MNSNFSRGIFLLIGFTLLIGSGISFAGQKDGVVEISSDSKAGKGPGWVHLRPKIRNLKGPLKFNWSFGDGEESAEMIPLPHYYESGRYTVVLEIMDKTGKLHTASITVDAASQGG